MGRLDEIVDPAVRNFITSYLRGAMLIEAVVAADQQRLLGLQSYDPNLARFRTVEADGVSHKAVGQIVDGNWQHL